jgi:hypothetical protein
MSTASVHLTWDVISECAAQTSPLLVFCLFLLFVSMGLGIGRNRLAAWSGLLIPQTPDPESRDHQGLWKSSPTARPPVGPVEAPCRALLATPVPLARTWSW